MGIPRRILPLVVILGILGACSDSAGVGSGDVDDFKDARSAIQHASIIVIGTPEEGARTLRTLPDGDNADYAQDVMVDTVLWGDEVAEVTIVRAGPAGDDQETSSGEPLRGPLRIGRQVFLLQKSGEPGMYSIVGHDVGAIQFAQGIVEDSPFPELNGMDTEELQAYVRDIMDPQ